VNLENVTRDDWIVGGLALLLAIFLFVLPWFHLSVTVGPFSASADFTATDDPDGWLAILAVIASLAVVADLAVERLSPQTQLPAIGGSRTNTRFILAAIAAGFIALKFLFHIHFGDFGWGFYVNVILTIALVYVAYQARAGQSLAIGGLGGMSRGSSGQAPPPPPPPPPGESAGTPPSGSAGSSGGSTPPPGS
jgi:hypothetical protein